MRYASPYTGSGRNYGIYTSYSAYKAEAGSLAQAPVASMSSTSRGLGSCGASTPIDTRTLNVVPVSGIYTAASAIRGGVTTYSAGHPRGGQRRSGEVDPGTNPEGSPDCGCRWVWDEEKEVYVCVTCGATWDLFDNISTCECDPCRCPITDGWQVWLMMALLAAAYAVRRNRKITQQ